MEPNLQQPQVTGPQQEGSGNDQNPDTETVDNKVRVVDVSGTSKLDILKRKPVLIGLTIGLVALLGGGAAAALVLARDDSSNKTVDKPIATITSDKTTEPELTPEAEDNEADVDPVTGQENGIKLTASNTDKGTVLSWTVYNVDVSKGFKVVRSSSSSAPTFGKDEAVYVDKTTSRSYTWKSKKAGTYWYRICAYRGDSCDNYSNAVKMDAVVQAKERVTRGTIALSLSQDNTIHWTYTGKAPHGYKVVMSTKDKPTYPEDGYIYYGNDTTYYVDLTGKPTGSYNIRVCAYANDTEPDGTKCLDYSNQMTVNAD